MFALGRKKWIKVLKMNVPVLKFSFNCVTCFYDDSLILNVYYIIENKYPIFDHMLC